MRKNTRAAGCRVLASKYCAITGEAPAAGSGRVAGAWAFMNAGTLSGALSPVGPHNPLNPGRTSPSCGWISQLVELPSLELRRVPRRTVGRRGPGAGPRDLLARDLPRAADRRLPGADERDRLRAPAQPRAVQTRRQH